MPKGRRVVWAPRAKQDLLNIWRYYARVASPEIAGNVLRGIGPRERGYRSQPACGGGPAKIPPT